MKRVKVSASIPRKKSGRRKSGKRKGTTHDVGLGQANRRTEACFSDTATGVGRRPKYHKVHAYALEAQGVPLFLYSNAIILDMLCCGELGGAQNENSIGGQKGAKEKSHLTLRGAKLQWFGGWWGGGEGGALEACQGGLIKRAHARKKRKKRKK